MSEGQAPGRHLNLKDIIQEHHENDTDTEVDVIKTEIRSPFNRHISQYIDDTGKGFKSNMFCLYI